MSSSNGKGKGREPANSFTGNPAGDAGGSGQSADKATGSDQSAPSPARGSDTATGAHGEPTGSDRGGQQGSERSSNTASQASSPSPSSPGTGHQGGSVLGKRPSSEVDGEGSQEAKRHEAGYHALRRDEVTMQRSAVGLVTNYQANDPSKRGKPFVVPNATQPDVTDVVFNLRDPRGQEAIWQVIADLEKQGAQQVHLTFVPVLGIGGQSDDGDLGLSGSQESKGKGKERESSGTFPEARLGSFGDAEDAADDEDAADAEDAADDGDTADAEDAADDGDTADGGDKAD